MNKPDWFKSAGFNPTDIDLYYSLLLNICKHKNFKVKQIGTISNYPIYLINKLTNPNNKSILFSAGFHGEEPAPPWGILLFLYLANDKLINQCNISFLPIVNPTGIVFGTRNNGWNENPNSGYCHNDIKDNKSKEGMVLLDNLPLLLLLSKDSFISLHEDNTNDKFYLYTYEKRNSPGKFTNMLFNIESKIFKPLSDDDPIANEYPEIGTIKNGIGFNHHDGSFEDFMFHKGIPLTACTETPGLFNVKLRIRANALIVSNCVSYFK